MTTEGTMLFPTVVPKIAKIDFNAGGVSAALNKWLKENGLAKIGQGLHSFRHTMRDRLREVEAPSDLIDGVGGWKRQGVGETYGQGHGLELKQKYLLKAMRTLDNGTAT
jgi:integrase